MNNLTMTIWTTDDANEMDARLLLNQDKISAIQGSRNPEMNSSPPKH